MALSGTEMPAPVAPVAQPVAPFAPPAGYSLVSDAEHNRVNAENRTLNAAAQKRIDDDAAAEATRQTEAAAARGDFDTALSVEQGRTTEANARADRLAASNTVRDEIAAQGFSGEQARALNDLVNLDAITITNGAAERGSVTQAVTGVVGQYPAMFKLASGTEPVVDPAQPAPSVRAAAPAVPVTQGQHPGVGYMSPEEYMATPQNVRLHDPEFAKRVAASRHKWPTEVSATSFAQDT